MSDGPHRSLPMRPWWKPVAERADKPAFDSAECADALGWALEREFSTGLRPTFLQDLRDARQEPGLFGPVESALYKLAPETPLESRVCDYFALASPADLSELDSFEKVLTNACKNEAPRFLKQIEEHYLRKSGPERASRERDRLEQAYANTDVERVVGNLMHPRPGRSARGLKKKTGLDDGVSLQ